jgi:outer membrane murein-binding lipoprotein Lpp
MNGKLLTAVALATSGLFDAGAACAQVQRSGGGETQKIMQEYQQLAAERTSMQAQIAQLKKDLDASKSDLAAMKKERDALKGHSGGLAAAAAQSNAAQLAAEQGLEQSKQRMNELVSRFRETAQNLKQIEAERNAAKTELSERNRAFDQCAESNVQLFEINKEILDRYEHVGLFTKASAGEPFTKLTRTRIENLVDEYRARAEELRIKKREAADAAAARSK